MHNKFYYKWKKACKKAAVTLALSAMLMQSVTPALAEEQMAVETELASETAPGSEPVPTAETEALTEKQTEAPTEAPTEKQTETPTEAPTEKQTEAPTEAPTEKQTEAPTEAPTEKQTEAPTEAPTEKQTEAPTEAPTEKQTEAPTEAPTEKQTEVPTEAPTEKQTEAPTEKQTEASTEKITEKQTEKETERSERVNDGKTYSAADIASKLKDVLPYMFVAEKIEVAERKEEETEEQTEEQSESVLESESESESESETEKTPEERFLEEQKTKEDASLTEGLKKFSKSLANAQSSKGVQVINLYADKNGRLDTAQLDKAFKDQKLKVSDSQFVIINIIADSKSQNLTVADYDMVKDGKSLEYEKPTQKGYVLYNFAAMNGKKFAQYEGIVTLSGTEKLQGTFLAPAAEVRVDADLAGAVYAKKIHVTAECEELMQVVFCNGQAEPVAETENESEYETESETESTEAEAAESGSEAAEAETAEDESAATEAEIAEDESIATEAETAEDENAATEAETAETEVNIEIESMTEIMTEASSEEMTEEMINGEILIDFEEYVDVVETVQWYTSETVGMQVKLDDPSVPDPSETEPAALAGVVHMSLKAAEVVTDADGKVVYGKDQEVGAWDIATEEPLNIGEKLTSAGIYYLTVDGGEKYLDGSRIYLVCDERGVAVLENSGWNKEAGLLTISVYQTESEIGRGLKMSLFENDGITPIKGDAVFVIRDKDGKVICNADGTPAWVINYNGAAVVLDSLAAGTYFISQVIAPEGYDVMADQTFAIEDGKLTELKLMNNKSVDTQKSLTVSAKTYYDNTLLTSEKLQSTYVALFTDEPISEMDQQAEIDLQAEEPKKKRVSEIKELTWQIGSDVTNEIVFDDLNAGTVYYVTETNAFGDPVTDADYTSKLTDGKLQPDGTRKELSSVTTGQEETEETLTAVLEQCYSNKKYPTDKYSYTAEILLKKIVKGTSGKAENTTDTFYLMLYKDAVYSQPLTETPISVAMNGLSELTQVYEVKKVTQYENTFYVKETDAAGNDLPDNYPYAVSYTNGGIISVSCGTAAEAVIENQLSSSVAMLGIKDAETGEYLPGVLMVLKNDSGKVIGKFTSKASETKWTVPSYDTTYYLSAVQAPTGYAPTADVAFSVPKGQKLSVAMECKSAKSASTDYQLTVSKQVYCDGHQVYAYDTTSGAYAAKGAYTFYAALFADKARTQKVSDVQKITVTGLGGTTTFKNLKKGTTYYLAETNQYGQPLSSTSSRSIKYSNSGKIEVAKKNQTAVIQNAYAELKAGYRHTGTMTINLKLLNAAGQALKDTETFYVGIYRNEDYSDKPTIVKMQLNDASSVSVKRRILLSGEADMVYYIAEVDASGKRITDTSSFGYKVTVDRPTLTLSRGDDKVVNLTNQVKSSKVTLYLTKKVYEKASLKKVNATFYAGLFKDPEFKQAYTKPIPMKLADKSELTLKLSLNLGNASEAKIYVAEVDENGKVIKSGKEFGYDVKVINSTVVFTDKVREVQSVLLNSVYSEASKENWQEIIHSENKNPQFGSGNHSGNYGENYSGGYDGGYSGGYDDDYSGWYVSDNGEASPYEAGSIETGDQTPILKYAWIMAAALLVMICTAVWFFLRRRNR